VKELESMPVWLIETLKWGSMILLLVVGLLLMGIILLQRGRGGGLAGAFGGMGGQSAFGTKAGDVFTKITIIMAVIWVLLAGTSKFFLEAAANRQARRLGDTPRETGALTPGGDEEPQTPVAPAANPAGTRPQGSPQTDPMPPAGGSTATPGAGSATPTSPAAPDGEATPPADSPPEATDPGAPADPSAGEAPPSEAAERGAADEAAAPPADPSTDQGGSPNP
jgi:preprotein translocase subunit SecG